MLPIDLFLDGVCVAVTQVSLLAIAFAALAVAFVESLRRA